MWSARLVGVNGGSNHGASSLLQECISEASVGGVVNSEPDEEAPPGVVTPFDVYLGKVERVVVFVGILANATEDVLNDPFEIL